MAKKLKLWFDFALAEKLAKNTTKVSKDFDQNLFLCISVFTHNPVILAIISLSKSFSSKYLLLSL